MASSILAVGNTPANSTNFDVTATAPVTVCLTGSSGYVSPSAVVLIQKQDSSGNWSTLDKLTVGNPIGIIRGTGTWRGVRISGNCGLDRD